MAVPREGHLNRATYLYPYISKMRHATLRVMFDMPDFSALPVDPNTYNMSIYRNIKVGAPKDTPKPLEKSANNTHYVDDNLYHAITIWHLITDILHLINKNQFDMYSKR